MVVGMQRGKRPEDSLAPKANSKGLYSVAVALRTKKRPARWSRKSMVSDPHIYYCALRSLRAVHFGGLRAPTMRAFVVSGGVPARLSLPEGGFGPQSSKPRP
jgi:hypothetical protein